MRFNRPSEPWHMRHGIPRTACGRSLQSPSSVQSESLGSPQCTSTPRRMPLRSSERLGSLLPEPSESRAARRDLCLRLVSPIYNNSINNKHNYYYYITIIIVIIIIIIIIIIINIILLLLLLIIIIITIHTYMYTCHMHTRITHHVHEPRAAASSQRARGSATANLRTVLRFWISEGLTQAES